MEIINSEFKTGIAELLLYVKSQSKSLPATNNDKTKSGADPNISNDHVSLNKETLGI